MLDVTGQHTQEERTGHRSRVPSRSHLPGQGAASVETAPEQQCPREQCQNARNKSRVKRRQKHRSINRPYSLLLVQGKCR